MTVDKQAEVVVLEVSELLEASFKCLMVPFMYYVRYVITFDGKSLLFTLEWGAWKMVVEAQMEVTKRNASNFDIRSTYEGEGMVVNKRC